MLTSLHFIAVDNTRKPPLMPRNFWAFKPSGNPFEDEFYGSLYADQFIAYVRRTKDTRLLASIVADMTGANALGHAEVRFFERLAGSIA